jgi:hypothetical protein
MLDNINSIAAKADMHIKTSKWIIKEIDNLVDEYKNLDINADSDTIDDLYKRMDHLQKRVQFEDNVCSDIVSKLKDNKHE